MLDHFYCHYQMMDMWQIIATPDGHMLKVPTNDFIRSLLALVHDYENYDIRLDGNSSYIKGLAKQIKNYNLTHYKIGVNITLNGGKDND